MVNAVIFVMKVISYFIITTLEVECANKDNN